MSRRRDTSVLLAVLDTGSPLEIGEAINELAGVLRTLRTPERERVAEAARKGLDSQEPVLGGYALRALGELGEDPGRLETGLDDTDWFVRLMALAALGRAKPPIRLEAIARLRDDPEPVVREAVQGILDDHDSRGVPKPRPAGRITWQEWAKRERAMIREDIVRRDGWNFLLWWTVFTVAIAGIVMLNHRTLQEAIGTAIVMCVGFAPFIWLRSWKGDHPWHPTSRFDRLEWVVATIWMFLTLLVAAEIWF